nr:MAG TPA: LPP20 lipoprotein factor [Caudoviricetes sp.]
MKRKHRTHRMPRTKTKKALVAILVPFLLVGCASLEKARQLFDTASQVCRLINSVRQCTQN